MSVEEKRIYDDRREGAVAFVASEQGVVVVELAGTQVGRFRIDRRCTARDVAAGWGAVAVATDEDVYVHDPEAGAGDGGGAAVEGTPGIDQGDGAGDGTPDDEGEGDDPYHPTGFGPAVAVGLDGDALIAAAPDRRICRCVDGEWFDLARIDHEVRAVDGNLVAAADGVYRADPDGLDHVGLDDGRDVATCGPYAATGDGLYELGNGWMQVHDGAFDVVACSPDRSRAHAAAGTALYERTDGEWTGTGAPADAPIAGIAHASGATEGSEAGTYAITEDGTLLARAADEGGTEWSTRNVGVRGVGGIAIP